LNSDKAIKQIVFEKSGSIQRTCTLETAYLDLLLFYAVTSRVLPMSMGWD